MSALLCQTIQTLALTLLSPWILLDIFALHLSIPLKALSPFFWIPVKLRVLDFWLIYLQLHKAKGRWVIDTFIFPFYLLTYMLQSFKMRHYSWWAQEHIGCQRPNLGKLWAKQSSYPLCYVILAPKIPIIKLDLLHDVASRNITSTCVPTWSRKHFYNKQFVWDCSILWRCHLFLFSIY